MYDLVSGEIFELGKVEKELLPFIRRMDLPIPEICPSTLRYSLAKYEVSEIYAAYDRLISLINTKRLVLERSEHSPTEAAINVKSLEQLLPEKFLEQIINAYPSIEVFTIFPNGISADRAKELILSIYPSAKVNIKSI